MERKDLPPVAPHQLRLTMVGPFRISTVNLNPVSGSPVMLLGGFALGMAMDGYETMVFRGGESRDLDVENYRTEAEALAGHEAMVAKWEATTSFGACERKLRN